ncbi:MAG: helix-turn-helix domain-containing protein [Pseudomonadota bacterium]
MGAQEFVESYFEAWNHADAEAVANHLATNGVYCDVPENIRSTQDELLISLSEFFESAKMRYELIGKILANDDTLAFQYRVIPNCKSDRDQIYQGAEFITLDDDAAITIVDYYDSPTTERPQEIVAATSPDSTRRKYAKSGLDPIRLNAYQSRLESVMRDDQVFLRSDMTLPKLAEVVDCSVNHLSQVINAGLGMSFFDYLNRYRIEHAKTLLAELDEQSTAILNIAYTVGFNSNSAFYSAFKKYVGQTPAQYRKTIAHSSH